MRRRLARWSLIGLLAASMLFVGSCPDGVMASPSTPSADAATSWLYHCPITRPFMRPD